MADENEDYGPADEGKPADEDEAKKPDDSKPEDEPEPKIERQKLYMIEFIVDDISLDFCNAKQLICFGEGKTVIEFTFLDIGPLRIIEDDFKPVKKHYIEGCSGTGSIKNGKSIIFGLKPQEAEEVAKNAILYVTIIKKTTEKEYRLGLSIIKLINMFKALLEMVEEGNSQAYFKNIKDCYKIKDINTGDLVGHIYAFVRLSCFNELIINKFKKDPTNEIDFRPEHAGAYTYRYNKHIAGPEDVPAPTPCHCPFNTPNKEFACCCPETSPAANCPQMCCNKDACLSTCDKKLDQWCPKTCNKFIQKFETIRESKKEGKGKGKGKGGKKDKKGKKK